MEDAITVIMIVVVFGILKPVVKAVLRGMGKSDHYRDR